MDITASLRPESVQHPSSLSFSGTSRGQLRNGQVVAVKTSRWEHERMPKFMEIWAKCTHANVVQLMGKATIEGCLIAVYEWHEYGSIRQYLDHHPTTDLYHLSGSICAGVAYLHENDIVHGSLSGRKILVSSGGVPRIQLSSSTSTTATATGPLPYYTPCDWMAPELLKSFGGQGTFASDVYALGMTILETITRANPYGDCTWAFVVREKVEKGELPARPTDRIPLSDVGNMVWDILCGCWSCNPDDRPRAKQVRDVMCTVCQTPRGVALRLMVRENTSVQDLVAHFEKMGLMNYTKELRWADIADTAPSADTAMAIVYKVDIPKSPWANNSGVERQLVAVKCVKHTSSYKKLKRAARELSCWWAHEHENILPVLGFAVVRGDLAMISPWMKNGSVTEYVQANPSCDRLGLCAQLTRAIAYLHDHNLVHGDVKGPNALVSESGIVKVTDFGVSIAEHQEIEFSTTSAGGGTQRWQAPEILLGPSEDCQDRKGCRDGDSSKEGDVYALGMTIIEIYTGDRPYGSMDWSGRRLQQVVSGQLRPSRPMTMPIDATGNAIWELLTRCWAGDPIDRPTASEVYERLMGL